MIKDSQGQIKVRYVDEVVLVVGGCGSLFFYYMNDLFVIGDGFFLVYWVGVELIDLEFIQFYLILFVKNGVFYGFVLEVVRGEGGCLVDENGCCVMVG